MLKKFSRLAIFIVILVSGLSFVQLSNLEFDFDLEQFFPVNDPDLEFFHEYSERFNSNIDDEYIFIGITNKNGIFKPEFLTKVDSLTTYLFSFDSIYSVYSVTNSFYQEMNRGQLKKTPILHYHHPELLPSDSTKLAASNEFKGFLISKDGKSISISAFHSPNLSDQQKTALLVDIRTKIDELEFDKSYLTAKILVEETYLVEIQRNLTLYLSISLVLISLTLYMLFQSFKSIWIPLVTIVFSISWTFGLMAYFEYPIDIISSLLPPVLAVICMSDVIHLYTKFIEELRKGQNKIDAVKRTFKDVGLATFFTSLTTAIGFFSLSFSNVIPIRFFGIFAGIGVLLSFVIVIVFILGFSLLSKEPKIVQIKKYGEKWNAFLSESFRFIINNRISILWVSIGVTVGSFYFINKIELNSSLLQEIPKDNPILEDYAFIETQFSGTRSFEMALILKDSNASFLDVEIVHQIDEINQFLKDSCGVGMLLSHVSFIKTARQAYDGGRDSGYRVPDSDREIYFLCNKIMQTEWAGEFLRYMTIDRKYCRVGGKLPDLTTIQFQELVDKFDGFYKKIENPYVEYKMTGQAMMLDKTTYSLPYNLLMGLLIVFSIISVIVGLMFKSIKMVFIVLVSNIVPLILMGAVMGLLGIYLKADTSIIFAVSLGIVVDDSIHYLSKFRIELGKGRSVLYALKRSYLSTGKAIIITTLLLLTGFMPLLLSSFGGAFYIGLLVSLCLVFAVIIDLTILPILVMLFYKK